MDWTGQIRAPTGVVSDEGFAPPSHEAVVPRQSEIRHGRATVRGVARNVQVRQPEQILQLRLDRYDADGNRLQPIGVEVFAYRGGLIGDGDHVEVSGRWRAGTLRATRLQNLTTGAHIKGWPRWIRAAIVLAVLGAFVAWILIIIFVFP
jgi:hypothetical protein